MKTVLVVLLLFLQLGTVVLAEDVPAVPVIDKSKIKLDVIRSALANIDTMRKQALADIEARYLRDKESRTKFFQAKEDELKAKEKALLEEIEKSKSQLN